MLRESARAYGYDVDLMAVTHPTIRMGVPGGNALLRFVDAITGVSGVDLGAAQQDVIEQLGPEALVDAAAVFGNFAMMNRIAEGTGIPLSRQMEAREEDLIAALGLREMKKRQEA